MPRSPISAFLLQHNAKIKSASLVAEALTLEVKDDLPLHEVLILFADLITLCRPCKATLIDPHRMRVEFA